MTALPQQIKRDLVWLSAALLGGALLVAGIVHIAFADAYRDATTMSFGGVPDTFSEVLAIYFTNARLLAGVGSACGLAAWVSAVLPSASADRRQRIGRRLILFGADLVIALLVAVNVAYVGAAFGAYGWPLAESLVPHGLFEIPAFVIGLLLYVQARRGQLSLRFAMWAFAIAFALLAVSAVLETYIG